MRGVISWPQWALPTLGLVLALSCGGGATGPSDTSEHLSERLTTPHFRILADRADAASLSAIAASLEAAYPRVTADLGSGELALVSAWVWADSASFEDEQRRVFGQVFQGSNGYVFGTRNLAVLVNSRVAQTAAHEFVHVVSLAVNPRIANNPRWLWETLALYENGEFVSPATVDDMRTGRYPTLAQLDADYNTSRQIYQVGYVLGEFIAGTWEDGLVRLLRTNGDVPASLGIPVSEFETRWYTFLRTKYGTP